ncbi:terminase large subunit domain-containing protein [Mycobacterium sp. 4D054]|uniref:terminase large subunit domain-containing protein n=1 Tax=Mycobacterium sp. 4D054 TaxID=3457440 RepID=UPI003FD4F291
MSTRRSKGPQVPPKLRALVAARALGAQRARRRPSSPAELAKRLDPKFVIVPVICLLSDIAVRSVTAPDQRDIATVAPRSGKSRLLSIWTVVWALMRDPDVQIMLVSYSDELATTFNREVRQIINAHSDFLGIRISADKSSTARFRIDGHAGQVIAAGIGSGLTGQGCDLMLIDDPVKNASEADSAAHRRRIWHEYGATLAPRVHPGGSVCLVQTRWHVEDLAGKLRETEPDVWTYTNVPAVAEVGIVDALDREPGAVMTSALGYTADHFAAARRTSGERNWYALYQGSPTTPAGGLIKAAWLDDWRLSTAPQHPVRVVVGVDPSDSGAGDSCGLVAASITSDGTVALLADQSSPMTSEQWASAAIKLAIATGASEIAIEGFSARETYVRVVNEALKRARTTRQIKVSSWPPKGSGRGGGDAIARASGLLQALETGTCRVVGHWPDFEEHAVQWQQGQHCPDEVSALVVAHDVLVHSLADRVTFTNPAAMDRRMRQDTRSPIEQRLGIRPGLGTVTPINARLTRRISGGGYDPMGYQRTTRRGL